MRTGAFLPPEHTCVMNLNLDISSRASCVKPAVPASRHSAYFLLNLDALCRGRKFVGTTVGC